MEVAQSCPTLCDPMDCTLLGSPWNSLHGNSPTQNTGVGSCSFLQGIFPTQGSNPDLPFCRRILYQLNHQGSPSDNAGDAGLIPGLGDPLEEGGCGNCSQFSCLENPHGQRSLAGYNPWGCKKSGTAEQLSTAHILTMA